MEDMHVGYKGGQLNGVKVIELRVFSLNGNFKKGTK